MTTPQPNPDEALVIEQRHRDAVDAWLRGDHMITEAFARFEREIRTTDAARIAELTAERDALLDALTPSDDTKAAYMGDFSIDLTRVDECGDEYFERVFVPWSTIKEIMAAVKQRATLNRSART